MTVLNELVDLDSYPIEDTASPQGRALLEQGRQSLQDTAVFALPSFIRPEALAGMQAEARALAPFGHHREGHRDSIGNALPSRVSVTCVGYDQIALDSPMRALFASDALTNFLGALLQYPLFYRSVDPMASCMLTSLSRGDELGWHFDENNGVVTLTLDSSPKGGVFEYVPQARELSGDALSKLMTTEVPDTDQLHHQAGTLAIFNGHDALHRVSPVLSDTPRLTLIFSYDTQPNQIFSEQIRMGFFNRTAPLMTPPSTPNP